MSGGRGHRSHGRGGSKGSGKKPAKDTAAGVCALASSVAVGAAFERLGPVNAQADCLDQSNGSDAAVLLAAEQVTHLLDAWRYLSSAITAYLTNSRENATHFAYYCELRAVLSLFAGSGIRVRQGDSFLIDSSGKKYVFQTPNMKTHSLTWDLWKEWIGRNESRDLMGQEIKLMPGLPLEDIALIPNASSAILQAWGYDLLLLADDHKARNSASYDVKPSEPLKFMTPAEPELIRGMWALLLNGTHGIAFDAALIRYFVSKYVAQAVTDDKANGGVEDGSAFLERVVVNTSKQMGIDAAVIRSLLTESTDSTIFDLAAEQKTEPENIICRAFLLLRFASLAVNKNIQMVPSRSCQQWIRSWLSHAGLYDPSACEPEDLITDYADALEEFYSDNSTELPQALWRVNSSLNSTVALTRAEAFVGWGLAV